MSRIRYALVLLMIISLFTSCKKKELVLYENHCASCHLAPDIESLPKHLWESAVLPEMAARMGIRDTSYNPYGSYSFREQEAILKTGIYGLKPSISNSDWALLKKYILEMAPDSVATNISPKEPMELRQFTANTINLDETRQALFTYLHFDGDSSFIRLGDKNGNLFEYDYITESVKSKRRFSSAPVDHHIYKDIEYVTSVGNLNPSEIPSGRIFKLEGDSLEMISQLLHRPVNTLVRDLDRDGTNELVVSEFGNLTGQLSLLTEKDTVYDKRTLINQPGSIRTVAKDMNGDGLEDLVVLVAQGNESIVILYQRENLNFTMERPIRFSPVYGSSWFELLDYDGDGDQDIITVHGDNADKTFINKPYHGMRIHLNDGNNQFEEAYFFPLNGATRVIAEDFDQDGDFDFGLLSTFPDYKNNPEQSFVYLENKSGENFLFEPFTFKEALLGRWLLMDSGDVDKDGDQDIILSSFIYSFVPVPKTLSESWDRNSVDLMVLENKLNNPVQ